MSENSTLTPIPSNAQGQAMLTVQIRAHMIAVLSVIAFVVPGVCFNTSARADDYDDAIAASKRGDHETAAKLLQPLADAGDARAQGALGYLYGRGLGVKVDHERAFELYRSAAKSGNAGAQLNLCVSYANGAGTRLNAEEGMRWCLEAAKQNQEIAHFNLGNAFAVGEYGMQQDDLRAYMHYLLTLKYAQDPTLKKFATESIEFMRRNMSQAEIDKAEKMAAMWPQEAP